MKKRLTQALLFSGCLMASALFTAGATYADDLDYVYGRPMTEEEITEQKSHEPDSLSPLNMTGISFADSSVTDEELKELENDSSSGLPTYYNTVKNGWVTSPKDQEQTQWCWAFSTASLIETSLIKNKVVIGGKRVTKNNINISEGALVDAMYADVGIINSIGKDKSYNSSVHGTLVDYDGNGLMLARVLSAKNHIYRESAFPFADAIYNIFPKSYGKPVAGLKGFVDLTNTSGSNTVIKKSIVKYGSVLMCVDYNSSYFNYDTAALCVPTDYGTNHSVTLVGWDDNYSASNFSSYSGVTKPGAWIVKNSFGTNWGDGGYFYLSYYDAAAFPLLALSAESCENYDVSYAHAGSNSNAYYYFTSDSTQVANVYTASSRQVLDHISFQTNSGTCTYSVQIYRKVKSRGNPTSGTPVYSTPIRGTTSSNGLQSVQMTKKIILEPKERFAVVITLKKKTGAQLELNIEMATDYGWCYTSPSISSGQSFYRTNSTYSWSDLYSEGYTFRINAYAKKSKLKKITVKNSKGKVIKTMYATAGTNIAKRLARKGYATRVLRGTTKVTKDASIYVRYIAKTYKYTLNPNGGSLSRTRYTRRYGKKVPTLPTPKRRGYVFKGWYTSRKFTHKMTASKLRNFAKDYTLYAKWERKR